MSVLTVAAVQFAAARDPQANLAAVDRLAARAGERGAELVVFPEATMAAFGTRLRAVAEPLDGPWADGVRAVAGRLGVWLVAGMFTPADDGRVHNTLLITDGERIERYDKRHCYDAFGYRESATVAPGERLVTVDALGTRLGFATCYDVRFGDQFTELGRRGAELVCLPASWQQGPGKAMQWELLARTRALDAQAFVVAADQNLVTDPESTALGVGRSLIAGPDGGVLAQAGDGEEILIAELDLDAVREFRRRVPILRAP